VWKKLAGAKRGKERLILQNTCQATAAWLKLDCLVIPTGFCQNIVDLMLSVAQGVTALAMSDAERAF